MGKLIGYAIVAMFVLSIIGTIIALIVAAAALVLFGLFCIGVAKLCVWLYREHQANKRSREAWRQAHLAALRQVSARADYEHQLYLHGDRRGIYGQYMPAEPF